MIGLRNQGLGAFTRARGKTQHYLMTVNKKQVKYINKPSFAPSPFYIFRTLIIFKAKYEIYTMPDRCNIYLYGLIGFK